MLTKVTAISPWAGTPDLVLNVINRPETDLFEVRNIDGLGAVKADVNTTPLGSIDGAISTGSNINIRNIVLTLGLDPNWDEWTVSRLRRLLDKYFMPKLKSRLVFESMEFSPVGIDGIVESNEPNMFSKDPEHQISIICPYPYFKAIDATVMSGQSSTDDPWVPLDYQGNVETGINVVVNRGADGIVPNNINIGINGFDLGDSVEVSAVPGGIISATEHLELNTTPGNKYIRRVDALDTITNLLNYSNVIGDGWPLISPGADTFFVWSDTGIQDWVLTYYDLYGSL